MLLTRTLKIWGVVLMTCFSTITVAKDIDVTEIRAIAKDAYVYGFPVVESYRIMNAYTLNKNSPEYKAPFNQIKNIPRVFTSKDRAIQTPNSDTPYSFAWLDLRAEPVVLTLPPVEKDRYYSVQLFDGYIQTIQFLGSRTTGNDGGKYLIVGPNWKGNVPNGISKVIHAETQMTFAVYRTQLKNADDLENVKKVQAGYKVETLSQYIGAKSPKAAPEVAFIPPLTPSEERTSPEFFNVLAFALQFNPTISSEVALRERFAKIGIEAGKPFNVDGLSAETKAALVAGMKDGQKEIDAVLSRSKSPAELSGTRKFLNNDYVRRAAGSQAVLFGATKEEAYFVIIDKDSKGQSLDGSQNSYTLRFPEGELPPANAFWSLTVYDLPERQLVDNSMNRYLINSTMLTTLKKAEDGSLILYVQSEAPSSEKMSNWLPVPQGKFIMFLRTYWPKESVLKGNWSAPEVESVK